MVLTISSARVRSMPWPRDLRKQAALVGMATLTAATAAVFSGGVYMSDRFASIERDTGGRIEHWRDGVGMLQTSSDWLIGMGSGRFPQNFMFSAGDREFPGGSHIAARGGKQYLVLSGPRREGGFGEMLRVAQRVDVLPSRQYSVVVDVRATQAAILHLELCERQLLYVDGCAIAQLSIPARNESLQRYVAQLDSSKLRAGTVVRAAAGVLRDGHRESGDKRCYRQRQSHRTGRARNARQWRLRRRHGPLVHDQRSIPPSMAHQEHRFEPVVRPGNDRLAVVRSPVVRRPLQACRRCRAGTPVRAISCSCIDRISAGGIVRQPAGRAPSRIPLLPAAHDEPCLAPVHAVACKPYNAARRFPDGTVRRTIPDCRGCVFGSKNLSLAIAPGRLLPFVRSNLPHSGQSTSAAYPEVIFSANVRLRTTSCLLLQCTRPSS